MERGEAVKFAHSAEFPTEDDWNALQGGKPRVFRNKDNPNAVWLVIHVYEQHPDAKRRFQSGSIVQTLPPHLRDEGTSLISRKAIQRQNDGRPVTRNISIPAFMDRTLHGDTCEARSESYGGGRYERISNQDDYEAYVENLRNLHYEELEFGENDKSFTLNPLRSIPLPLPLAEITSS